MSKPRVATLWLDGCSGCHMSLLDTDESLIELLQAVELVYSPLIDIKEFPEGVDVALVEGALGSEEDLEKIRLVRARSKFVAALGDCAVTGNVPSMRNQFGPQAILERAYIENATIGHCPPSERLPRLLERSVPIHEAIAVDLHIPGCPPSAEIIHYVLSELVAGRAPDLSAKVRFG